MDSNAVDHPHGAQLALVLGLSLLALVALPSPSDGQTASDRAAPLPGLGVERHRLPRASTTGVGDRTLTLVRVDPARYRFRMLSEGHEGERRALPQWVRDEGLVGGINAGMFLPSGRSVGFLMQGDEVRSDRRPRSFSGYLGFDPRRPGAPLFRLAGRGCGGGLDWMRERYRSVLQVRAVLVDCEGHPGTWRTRRYSMAAIGRDTEGRVVLAHVRTPYRMHVLNRMITSLGLGIRGLVYLEGGPEASLVVNRHGENPTPVRAMGSWEDGFNPNDDNRAFWDLPNVIGFEARE